MAKTKIPSPDMLEVLKRDYTYDPDTGIIYRQGKKTGTRKDANSYIRIQIRKSDPNYLTVMCECLAHQAAWYLTHGVWIGGLDHINGNPADNRLDNLRLATQAQNSSNTRKQRGTYSSQYKGVSWSKSKGKWHVCITAHGKQTHHGDFTNEVEAAQTYDRVARILHGEFARLNFPTTPHQDLPGDVGVGK